MSVYGWFVVILVTSAAVLLGVGWLMEHADRRRELLAELDQATANVQLPRAGYLPAAPFAGAADPAQMIRPPLAPVPWDLAGAAYLLGQQRADQDEVSREVDAIMAEIEANPERWQT